MSTNLVGRVVVYAALLLSVSACSWFSWLPWVGDDKKEDPDEPAELVKFDPEIRLDRLWRAKVGKGLGRKYLRLSPALVADRIIAADGYGHVQAHDRFTGKRLWRVQTHTGDGGFFSGFRPFDRTDPSFVSGGVAVGEGMVLIGTTNGEVLALNVSDGQEVWRARLGSEVLAVAAVDEGRVFTQTIDGRLVALSASDGELLWTYDNQVPILTLRGTSSPLVEEGVVYAGFANGKVMALRAENGEPVWEHRVMLPEGRSELDRMVDVDAQPLLLGPVLFTVAYNGRVKAVTRAQGRMLWQYEFSSHLDLAQGYSQVYAVDEDDTLVALDQQTGEVVWETTAFKNRKLTAPVAYSNYVVVGDDDGYLHVLAQRDGRMLGRRKVDGDGLRSTFKVAETTLFVLGNSGSLQAFNIELK